MMPVALPAQPEEPLLLRVLRRLIARQPLLARTALAMVLLAIPAAVLTQIDPRLLDGVSVWTKPFKFLLSLGVYLGTLAWFYGLLPGEVRRSPGGRWLAWVAVVTATFEVAYISLQAARGEASHFNTATPFTAAMYSLMGVGAVTLSACSPWLAVLVARHNRDGVYRQSVILGLWLTFLLGAVGGMYMGSQTGHWVGGTASDAGGLPLFGWSRDGGDLRVAHFLGIHAMQILPLAGWLLRERRGARMAMLGTTLLFMVATAGLFAQAVLGRPLL